MIKVGEFYDLVYKNSAWDDFLPFYASDVGKDVTFYDQGYSIDYDLGGSFFSKYLIVTIHNEYNGEGFTAGALLSVLDQALNEVKRGAKLAMMIDDPDSRGSITLLNTEMWSNVTFSNDGFYKFTTGGKKFESYNELWDSAQMSESDDMATRLAS